MNGKPSICYVHTSACWVRTLIIPVDTTRKSAPKDRWLHMKITVIDKLELKPNIPDWTSETGTPIAIAIDAPSIDSQKNSVNILIHK